MDCVASRARRSTARATVPLRLRNAALADRVWSVAVRTADAVPVGSTDLAFPEQELWVPPGPLVVDVQHNGQVQRSIPITVGERGATVQVP